jgi:hypothetical protein
MCIAAAMVDNMNQLLHGNGLAYSHAVLWQCAGSVQAWDSSSACTFSPCVQAPAAASAALNNGVL